MDAKVEQHLKDYSEKKGWTFDATNEDAVLRLLQRGKEIKRTLESEHRWYDEYTYIVLIDGMLISYDYARSTGDTHPRDMDYELDMECIYEVKEVKEMVEVTKYVAV